MIDFVIGLIVGALVVGYPLAFIILTDDLKGWPHD